MTVKVSLTIILAVVACAYSTGCVLYHEYSYSVPPDYLLYPITPGIWVGMQVDQHFDLPMVWSYAAGIGTMTVLGALLGLAFEFLCDSRRAGAG